MLISQIPTTEYNDYYARYITLVKDYDIMEALSLSQQMVNANFGSLSKEKQEFRYETGKWTPKEMLVHIIDTERIFAYRALRIGRNDKTHLCGFEQDNFIEPSKANDRPMRDILEEYNLVRFATIALSKSIPNNQLTNIGTASGNETSSRAALAMIAGHDVHHCQVLQEKYLENPV